MRHRPPDTTQQRLHDRVGRAAVDELMRGYNSAWCYRAARARLRRR